MARDIREGMYAAENAALDIALRNPGPAASAADAEALGGQPPTYYAQAQAPQYSTATRPAANSSTAGMVIRLKDAAAPEQVQVCITTSSGGYEWVTIALASS